MADHRMFPPESGEHVPEHCRITGHHRNLQLGFHRVQTIHRIEHGTLKIYRIDGSQFRHRPPGIGHDIVWRHLQRVGVVTQNF